MSRVVMWEKRSLTLSHQSTKRSTRQSLVTLEVTAYTKSSSEAGRKIPSGVTVALGSRVVIGGRGCHATLASAGKRAHFDRGRGHPSKPVTRPKLHPTPRCAASPERRWHPFQGVFLGLTLGHLFRIVPQLIELGPNGFSGRQFLVAIPLLGD